MANRKDYEAIAAILRREHQKVIEGIQAERDPMLVLTILSNKIAGYFQADNANFDWNRFCKAARCDEGIPAKWSGCFCTECNRRVDEETFEELSGECEMCYDQKWLS